MRLRTKPKEYQRKGVRKIRHFGGRTLLADEMGLGKSLQALMYCLEKNTRLAIVICPAFLKPTWEYEIHTHLGARAHVCEGRVPPASFKLRHKFLVINYDILGGWLPLLRSLKADVIIIDECQKVGDRRTKQSKNVRLLCRGKRKSIIMLSGTPSLNRPAELFTALNILRPDVFPSFKAFAERHCRPEWKPWGWQYKGAENLGELHRKLQRTCMVRRLKSDVLPDLPAKERHPVPLDIKNRKEYDAAVLDFIGWLTKQNAGRAKKAAKAASLVRMGYLKRLVAKLKMDSVFEWIDNFLGETDEKLVVFGHHKAILQALHDRYPTSVLVNGTTSPKNRKLAVSNFHQKKKCRLFFANLKAAGTGWSCKCTSSVAFVEFGWTPGEHSQGEDRVHGIGRGMKGVRANFYYLFGRGTIEEDLASILQEKQKNLKAIFDGETRGDRFDIFDQLTGLLKGRLKRR